MRKDFTEIVPQTHPDTGRHFYDPQNPTGSIRGKEASSQRVIHVGTVERDAIPKGALASYQPVGGMVDLWRHHVEGEPEPPAGPSQYEQIQHLTARRRDEEYPHRGGHYHEIEKSLAEAAAEQGFGKSLYRIGFYATRAACALADSRPRESAELLEKAIVHADGLPALLDHEDAVNLGQWLRQASAQVAYGRQAFGLLGQEAAAGHYEVAADVLSKAIVAAPPPQALPPTPPAIHGAAWHAAQTPRYHPTDDGQQGEIFTKQGPDTKDLNSHEGVYTPQRQALHQQITHHFLSGADHGPDQPLAKLYGDYANGHVQPDAVFTVGGAGSGKSYYAQHKFLKHPRFASIDADAIKEHLANAEGKPGDHNTNASHYHEESSDISKHMQEEAHKQRKSYVFDGTGANPKSLAKKMQSARDAGYRVHLHYANVPFETALQRDAGRARSLQKLPGGREAMQRQHARVAAGFNQVKGLAHKVHVFDSTNDTVSPYALRRKAKMEMEKAIVRDMKKVTLHPHDHYILGTISNGNLHIHDVVHHGSSERMITGSRSRLRAIPMSDLKMRFPGLTVEDHHE